MELFHCKLDSYLLAQLDLVRFTPKTKSFISPYHFTTLNIQSFYVPLHLHISCILYYSLLKPFHPILLSTSLNLFRNLKTEINDRKPFMTFQNSSSYNYIKDIRSEGKFRDQVLYK